MAGWFPLRTGSKPACPAGIGLAVVAAWPNSKSPEFLQFLTTRLAEIPERVAMLIDPSGPHFLQGHVGREICIDDDTTHRVGALHDSLR
jgi:hypothetical protein